MLDNTTIRLILFHIFSSFNNIHVIKSHSVCKYFLTYSTGTKSANRFAEVQFSVILKKKHHLCHREYGSYNICNLVDRADQRTYSQEWSKKSTLSSSGNFQFGEFNSGRQIHLHYVIPHLLTLFLLISNSVFPYEF